MKKTYSVCIIVLLAIWMGLVIAENGLTRPDEGNPADDSLQMKELSCPPDGQISLGSIKEDETVLALHYINFAWGYQEFLLVADKSGRYKCVDFDEGEGPEENLLACMDACMGDGDIPYQKRTMELSRNLLEKVISTEDFELEKTGEAYDAGSLSYYSVYGSGKDRKLVCMQEDGNSEWHSSFFEARGICEKLYELCKSAR